MPTLHERDDLTVTYDGHPARTDSHEYGRSRKWLMGDTAGGCYVCGGPVDLSHPGAPTDAKGMQDHHGAGLFLRDGVGQPPIFVGFALAPLEWAGAWGASPDQVRAFAEQYVAVSRLLGATDADLASLPDPSTITDTAGVMAWVDSIANANVKLCAQHHVAPPDASTKDAQGNEAVGIHHCPMPIWALQATCDWRHFDMWGGSTGTLAVAPDPEHPGGAVVLHVDHRHPDKRLYRAHVKALAAGKMHRLAFDHPHARAARRVA